MSNQTTYDKLDILGVEIDVITTQEAIAAIVERAGSHKPACYAVKPYVEFLDRSYHDLEVQTLLNQAEWSLADGVALQWAAAYLYAGPHTTVRFWRTLTHIILAPHELAWPLVDRTAGINFTLPLLEAAAAANLKVALVGTPRQGTIQHTADVLRERIPQLNVVITHGGIDPNAHLGQQSRSWLDHLALDLSATHADLILLGLGFPRQEYAAAYLAEHLDRGVIIGEGGTFDYAAFGGHRAKAPVWVQRVGLEWAWRLLQEPGRWKRQLAVPRFIWRIWRRR